MVTTYPRSESITNPEPFDWNSGSAPGSTPRGMKSLGRNGPTDGMGTVTNGRRDGAIDRMPTIAGLTRWAAFRKLAESDSAWFCAGASGIGSAAITSQIEILTAHVACRIWCGSSGAAPSKNPNTLPREPAPRPDSSENRIPRAVDEPQVSLVDSATITRLRLRPQWIQASPRHPTFVNISRRSRGLRVFSCFLGQTGAIKTPNSLGIDRGRRWRRRCPARREWIHRDRRSLAVQASGRRTPGV